MHTVISLSTEVQGAFAFAEMWSLRRTGITFVEDLFIIWLVQKSTCSLNRCLSHVFSITTPTVLPHLARRCKGNMQFNDRTNGRAERHPEFQSVSSLFGGRVWESRCTNIYTK